MKNQKFIYLFLDGLFITVIFWDIPHSIAQAGLDLWQSHFSLPGAKSIEESHCTKFKQLLSKILYSFQYGKKCEIILDTCNNVAYILYWPIF